MVWFLILLNNHNQFHMILHENLKLLTWPIGPYLGVALITLLITKTVCWFNIVFFLAAFYLCVSIITAKTQRINLSNL